MASLVAADAAAAVAPPTALGHLERALALWDEVGSDDDSRVHDMWPAAGLARAAEIRLL